MSYFPFDPVLVTIISLAATVAWLLSVYWASSKGAKS